MRKYFAACFILLLSLSGHSQGWKPASRGILDLRDVEFHEHAQFKLNGEWEFYWKDFIQPSEFHTPADPIPTLYADVPGYWKDYEHEEITFPGTGYATYRLRILLPQGFDQSLGFDVPPFDASATLFVDGREILSEGRPGTTEAGSDPEYKPATAILTPVSDTLEVILHVSNFQHRRGAFWKPIRIGNPWMIIKSKQQLRLIYFVSLGFLLAFSLFFLFFYILYRKDMIVLSFSLVLGGVFIRMVNTDPYPVTYIMDLSWEWMIKLEYLGSFIALVGAFWYFYRLFPSRYTILVTWINTYLVIVAGLIVLFFKVRIFAWTMLYFQPAIVLLLLYYLGACIYSIYKGKRENIYFLAGMVLFLAALVNDIMVANSITTLSKGYTSHFALQVFVFIQAVLIIRVWISAFKEREKLMDEISYINKNLEKLVDERTQEVSQSNRELQEALDFKNRVFSIIAHDLKSPVASLVQNSALLDFDLSPENNKKLIDSFRELSNSALNLIDNLLYWGRSQGSQLKYEPEHFNIMEPVEEIMKLYREMAGQKSISLEWEMEGSTSVYADRELFKIICRNLLTNAIKFTGRRGKVRISSFYKDGDDKLIYSVSDTGVGIPEERLATILSGPDLVSTAGTDKEKGTGLGLRLCHELALINKGELRIESKENEGTTISLSIPVRAPGA